MRIVLFALLVWSVAFYAPMARATEEIEFGCEDLVVVGRIRSLTYTPINDPDDILGHGLWSTEIRIQRTLHGSERARRIYATVISHAQIRDDVDFLIALAESAGPGYVIKSFNAVGEARLAPYCTSANP